MMPQSIFYAEKHPGQAHPAGEAIRARHRERLEARAQGSRALARVIERQKEEGRQQAAARAARRERLPATIARASLSREELNRIRREAYKAKAPDMNPRRREDSKSHLAGIRRQKHEWNQAHRAEISLKNRERYRAKRAAQGLVPRKLTQKSQRTAAERWRTTEAAFVGDAGMVSAENLSLLARSGGKYIVCMPIHRGAEIATEVLTRPGRYQSVAENLQVKEVIVGDGERRRRYVVCYKPQEAERQARHRQEVLEELAAEIDSLRESQGSGHTKRVCELRASGRYGRYVRLTKNGHARIDQAHVAAAAALDGKFVVHSNDDTLTAADLALGYKQLQRVECAWRQLKSGLKLRPVYHWAPHRIHAHVALTVLALLLERVAEQACADTWGRIRDDLKRIKLAQLSSPNGMVWQVTEPPPEALNRLKSLKIPKPPPVLKVA